MQNKKRGKKRKLEQRALEEERVVQQLKKQLEGKVSAESLDWLPRTATAQKYIKNQALSETGDVLSLQAIDKLVKGDKTVQQRTTEIKRAIKDRLILSERSKLGEKWVEYSINATVPGGSTFGLGAEFSPMVHPTGILIKKFVKIPGGEKGALEVTGKVAVGDVIVSINGAKVAAGNIHTAMMTLSMIAQVALFSKMDQKLKLVLSRFERASPNDVATAIRCALEPSRLAQLESSPLIVAFARATQPLAGKELEYWLLNRSSVVSEIFAPYDRRQELENIFQKYGRSLEGENGLLRERPELPEMYDLYDISGLLQKYIDNGEVGRGRNKTSLKTAKQVCTAVISHLKKVGGADKF
jgi:hypothetical protein